MYSKLQVIDFLRGFSIFTIVLMHLVQSYPLPGWLFKITSFGGAGVHVFILCSGFGLYLSDLKNTLSYPSFLKKRFGRIYWPMAIICLLTAIWMAFQGKEWLMPLLSNLFLFKMFVPKLECSMGGQMWFISTIIQFYLAWPLIIALKNVNKGGVITLVISLSWSTLVAYLGHSEERVWNSFFLQYLWEFYLGIKLAELYTKYPFPMNLLQWKWLIPLCIIGIALTGLTGWLGFPWRLYNDIPSLIGYTSTILIIYKINLNPINQFFCNVNRYSYEWYLIHVLVFQIVIYLLGEKLPIFIVIPICLLYSYLAALCYASLLNKKYFRINNR